MKIANNYNAWMWNYKNIPQNAEPITIIHYFLQAGILAASIHNTQPWKFEVRGNELSIYPDLRYYLHHADPKGKNLLISLGCSIANIECAAGYHGYGTEIKIMGSSVEDTAIQIKFIQRKDINRDIAKLAPYITERYSNKLQYKNIQIDNDAVKQLKTIKIDSQNIFFTKDRSQITTLANIQSEAVKDIAANIFFGKELSSWLRHNKTRQYDGMPGFVVGLKNLASVIIKKFLSFHPKAFSILAKKDRDLIINSPLVGVIFSKDDSIESWIKCGIAYELLCLKAFSQGIHIAPMHAVVENQNGISYLRKIFVKRREIPQMFFRMGYADNKAYHTPRRNLNDSMLNTETQLARTINTKIQIKQIRIDNKIINYIVCGKGKPLLLIHGGNIGWGQFYPNLTELSKSYTIYAIDLPGAGRSTTVDYASLDPQKDLVDVVSKFLDALRLNSIYILGSSIGGWITLKLALENHKKVKKIIIVDGIGFSSYARFSDKIIRFYPFAKFLTNTFLKPQTSNKNIESFLRDVFFNKKVIIREEFIDYFYETMRRSHNLLFISRLSQQLKSLVLTKELPNVSIPTLIIWGERDKFMPLRKNSPSFSLIKNVKTAIIKNAGHIPSIEKSDEFNLLVKNFLLS